MVLPVFTHFTVVYLDKTCIGNSTQHIYSVNFSTSLQSQQSGTGCNRRCQDTTSLLTKWGGTGKVILDTRSTRTTAASHVLGFACLGLRFAVLGFGLAVLGFGLAVLGVRGVATEDGKELATSSCWCFNRGRHGTSTASTRNAGWRGIGTSHGSRNGGGNGRGTSTTSRWCWDWSGDWSGNGSGKGSGNGRGTSTTTSWSWRWHGSRVRGRSMQASRGCSTALTVAIGWWRDHRSRDGSHHRGRDRSHHRGRNGSHQRGRDRSHHRGRNGSW
jgi:hypothetical protein